MSGKPATLTRHSLSDHHPAFTTQLSPVSSDGHIEIDISKIDIFVNIYIVSTHMRKYRYFDIKKEQKQTTTKNKSKKR